MRGTTHCQTLTKTHEREWITKLTTTAIKQSARTASESVDRTVELCSQYDTGTSVASRALG